MDKPGYKTTEFWLTLLAMVLSMLFAAGVFGEQSTVYRVLEVGAAVLAGLGYTVTRGGVKKAAKPPE
jgi:hypothetical protein